MDCTVHKLVADIALVAEDGVLLVRYRDTSGYDGQAGWFLSTTISLISSTPMTACGES